MHPLKIVPITLLFTSFSLFSCSTIQKSNKTEKNRRDFIEFQKKHPQLIWNSTISDQTREALKAYQKHQSLSNGLVYGDSVRYLNLEGKSAQTIDSSLQKKDCLKRSDFLKNPKNQEALLDSQGKKIPLLVYLCPDGGVVRIKPMGDPTSKFRTQPHSSKSLRYPADSPYLTFDDEMLKVDNQGYPIPKWTKDLNPDAGGKTFPPSQFIEGWAEDAHTDLPH